MMTMMLAVTQGCLQSRKSSGNQGSPPNKVIAHRGAWKHSGAPQNSLASLREAIRLGCGGSEFDIRMTSDGILVINHDADFLGIPVDSNPYAALLKKKMSNGESIPTFEAYLKTGMSQKQTKLIAEIKVSTLGKEHSLRLAEKVVETVHRLKAQNWVTYISFDYDICKKVKQIDPGARVQYLNGDASAEKLKADGLDADYHFSVFQKNKGWIADARSKGIVVNAWTVNNPAIMDELLAQGIDLITTDEPEMLLKKLQDEVEVKVTM